MLPLAVDGYGDAELSFRFAENGGAVVGGRNQHIFNGIAVGVHHAAFQLGGILPPRGHQAAAKQHHQGDGRPETQEISRIFNHKKL